MSDLLARGLDVAGDNQPLAKMRYADWYALGFRYGWVEYFRAGKPIKDAAAHRQAMRQAGCDTAGYFNLGPGDGAQQARDFLAAAEPGEIPVLFDIEQGGLTAAIVLAAAWTLNAVGCRFVAYGNYGTFMHILPFDHDRIELAGLSAGLVIGSYPYDAAPQVGPDGKLHDIQPMDAASVARRFNPPPAILQPVVPAPWTWGDVLSWQATGHGSLPGYDGFVDLHVTGARLTVAEFESRYGVAMTNSQPTAPSTVTGCLFGGHTQGNSDIIPIYTDLKNLGEAPRIIISDEDGGKMIDAQRIGVPTRINRKQHPETGPDHDFELGGAGRLGWPADMQQRFVDTSASMPYRRSSVTEFLATSFHQAGYNEWECQSIEEWNFTLDLFLRMLQRADSYTSHDIAGMMGISVDVAKTLPRARFILPIFNAGSPHTWAMYVAIAKHPIWAYMAAHGHIIGAHEGIAFGQPFTFGENQPVEPGAPMPPAAGLVNFRIDNLLWLLWQRGIKINYAILEWYDGRKRTDPIEPRIDNLIAHDLKLAHQGGPWRAYCLGYCTYELTNDQTSKWYPQDFTEIWRHPRWQAHLIAQKGRINGGDDMLALYHVIALQDLAIRDLQGNPLTDPAGAPPVHPGQAGVIQAGTLLHVYQENVLLPASLDLAPRVLINPLTGANVWGGGAAVEKAKLSAV